jgi:hypothetical protein
MPLLQRMKKETFYRLFDIALVLLILYLWPVAKEGIDKTLASISDRPGFSKPIPSKDDSQAVGKGQAGPVVSKSLPENLRPSVNLLEYERKVFSQNGEDGVLDKIFELITPTSRFAVEFGASDGITGSNVRNLIINKGWSGLLIEGDCRFMHNLRANYRQAPQAKTLCSFVYPGNVEVLFEEQGVPTDLDLLVIDIDSNDYYVWRVMHEVRPKVVVIEYNPAYPPPTKAVVEYHPLNYWDGSDYYGASIQSLYELGKKKGYELVYAESSGTNLFFVDEKYFDLFGIKDNSPETLYYPPQYGLYWGGRAPNGRGHPPFDLYTDLWGLRKPYAGDLSYDKVSVPKKMVFGR